MSEIKFELDTSAVRSEILQAGYMLAYVTDEAKKQTAGDVKPFIGFDRAKALIKETDT